MMPRDMTESSSSSRSSSQDSARVSSDVVLGALRVTSDDLNRLSVRSMHLTRQVGAVIDALSFINEETKLPGVGITQVVDAESFAEDPEPMYKTNFSVLELNAARKKCLELAPELSKDLPEFTKDQLPLQFGPFDIMPLPFGHFDIKNAIERVLTQLLQQFDNTLLELKNLYFGVTRAQTESAKISTAEMLPSSPAASVSGQAVAATQTSPEKLAGQVAREPALQAAAASEPEGSAVDTTSDKEVKTLIKEESSQVKLLKKCDTIYFQISGIAMTICPHPVPGSPFSPRAGSRTPSAPTSPAGGGLFRTTSPGKLAPISRRASKSPAKPFWVEGRSPLPAQEGSTHKMASGRDAHDLSTMALGVIEIEQKIPSADVSAAVATARNSISTAAITIVSTIAQKIVKQMGFEDKVFNRTSEVFVSAFQGWERESQVFFTGLYRDPGLCGDLGKIQIERDRAEKALMTRLVNAELLESETVQLRL